MASRYCTACNLFYDDAIQFGQCPHPPAEQPKQAAWSLEEGRAAMRAHWRALGISDGDWDG
jgi:hypothetical protein